MEERQREKEEEEREGGRKGKEAVGRKGREEQVKGNEVMELTERPERGGR